MLAAAAIALTGCNKQTELEINYGKTATVKGKVILDDGSGTDKAGTNIKVYAEINYSDLVAQGSAAQGVKTFETITDAEGEYQFELPVTDNAILKLLRCKMDTMHQDMKMLMVASLIL